MILDSAESVEFTKENIYEFIHDIWDNHVPFHKHINQKIINFDKDSCEISLKKTDNLIIDISTQRLHGGVIASILDNTGALLALTNFIEQFDSTDINYIIKQSQKIGTLDLNINYLSPGSGDEFISKGKVIRRSKRLVLAEMTLYDENDVLVATATGKYMIK